MGTEDWYSDEAYKTFELYELGINTNPVLARYNVEKLSDAFDLCREEMV